MGKRIALGLPGLDVPCSRVFIGTIRTTPFQIIVGAALYYFRPV